MTRQDPHSRITDRILAELEAGTRPWLKPWSGGDMAGSGRPRPLRASGEAYRGINVLLLWIEAQASGFVSPSWMTYKQAQALSLRPILGLASSRVRTMPAILQAGSRCCKTIRGPSCRLQPTPSAPWLISTNWPIRIR